VRARRAANGALSGALLGAVIAVIVTLVQDGGIDPARIVIFAAVFAAIRGVRVLVFPSSAGEGLLGLRRPDGASSEGDTSDGPSSDGPSSEGPSSDGPGSDGDDVEGPGRPDRGPRT
jgi:hypothetical protein